VSTAPASEEFWSRCPEYDVPNFTFLHHRVPDCTGSWELQRICAYDVYACPRCYTRHLVTERTILAVEAERRLEVMLQSELKAPPAS
jgi:DNA-directed RNA polymerase subunit RPC12/RpoP